MTQEGPAYFARNGLVHNTGDQHTTINSLHTWPLLSASAKRLPVTAAPPAAGLPLTLSTACIVDTTGVRPVYTTVWYGDPGAVTTMKLRMLPRTLCALREAL